MRWWQGRSDNAQYCVDPQNPQSLYIGGREVDHDTIYTISIDSTQLQVIIAAPSYSYSPPTQTVDATSIYPTITGTRSKVFPYYIPDYFVLPYRLTTPDCVLLDEIDEYAYYNYGAFFQPTLYQNGVIHWLVDDSQYTFTIAPPDYMQVYNRYTLNNKLTCDFNLTYGTKNYPGYLTVVYDQFTQDSADTVSCEDCSEAGEPINLTNGNTWVTQTDYAIPGIGGGLGLSRTWNSLWPRMNPPSTVGLFGNGWTSEWEQQVQFSLAQIGLWRGNGSQWIFTWSATDNAYTVSSPPDEKAALVVNPDGTSTVRMKDGFQYIFNSNGRLQQTQDRNGNRRTLAWSGSRLQSVTDDAGRSLTFAYGDAVSPNLVTAASFGNKVVASFFYSPDSNHCLLKVLYPDNSGYNFQYLTTTDPAMQGLIQQVQDFDGKVLEAHTYDAYRRGLTSGRADVDGTGPVEGITVTYDPFSGMGTVTNSLGDGTAIGYTTIGRRQFVTFASGPGCATCGSRGMNSFWRDEQGRVMTHFVPTTNAWDNPHGISFTYDDNNNVTSATELLQDPGMVGSLRGEELPALASRRRNKSHHGSAPSLIDTSYSASHSHAPQFQPAVVTWKSNNSPFGIWNLLLGDPFMWFQSGPPDPNVKTWSFTYNSFAEVTTQTDPLGNVTTNTYDDHGNLLSTVTPDAGTTTFTYDTHGNLASVTDPRGNTTQTTYTAAGLVETVTDAQQNVTRYEYDVEGNRTAIVDPAGNRTQFTYDARNRLTGTLHPDATTEAIAYDKRGRKTSLTARGVTTTYAHDDADRLISVIDPSGNTTYAYDTEDELISITDALNRTTSYTWGAPSWGAGRRLLQTTFPSGAVETYQYDNAGRVILTTLRDGGSVSAAYDNVGRITRKSFSDSTGTNTGTISFTYDLANHLTQVTDPNTSSSYTYDAMGRKVSSDTVYAQLPSQTFTLSYAYDKNSNRTQMTYPGGETAGYTYDSLNRLTALTDSEAGTFNLTYDALNRRTSLTRPNGVSTTYAYDVGSKLLSLTHQGPSVLDGAAYLYNANANRTQRTDLRTQTVEQYTYDAVNQLVRVDQSTPSTSMAVKERFLYDAVGNRLGADTAVNTYDVSNALLSTPTASYTYDANGNLSTTSPAAATPITYTWDPLGRLVGIQGQNNVTFAYDYLGRRISKNTAFYIYDGPDVVAQIDAAGGTTARFLHSGGVDEHLAVRPGTQWYYYEQDLLGSVTSLTDASGSVATGYGYSTFGNPAQDTGSLEQPYRYTGREWDSESGLYYYRARYYDSSSGRFLSEDPARNAGGINYYAYVHNDATNSTDPLGLLDIFIWNFR
ncbi:MAG TPA: RHS repeat-associated core domain-containing protein, partial [Candidatus Angelobacter sp.]